MKARLAEAAAARYEDIGSSIVKTAQTPELRLLRATFWQREHHLDKMTLAELVKAYFTYPAIVAYLTLAVASIGVFIWSPAPLVPTLLAIATAASLIR